jgi:DNA polymerase-3 subunit alpha
METCESLGLLKVDFLGLSTLTILRRASDLIYRHHNKRWTMENIPYRPHEGDNLTAEQQHENQMLVEAFEMLGRGETVGVFQVESVGMQQMLRGMKPTKYEHIVAGISLYRPGPMDFIPQYNARMHGREETTFLHPKLEPILGETYSIIVYQEQIMQIASALFGYDMGEADLMRRAVSKKKQKALEEHKGMFMERGPQNGVPVDVAEEIFEQIAFFANYGFNKSHAADYGMVTVQTGFLKCHYPAEYMAALLSVYREDTTKVSSFLEECGRLNIAILPPDVNHSQSDFDIQTLPDGTRGVRFGLAAIKNAGVAATQHILDAREAEGEFTTLTDFCERVDLRQVGKRTLESLVKVGALDDFADHRGQLLDVLDRMIHFSTDNHEARSVGQFSLFGEESGLKDEITLPDVEPIRERDQLDWEKELLGFYITDHPVDAILRHVDAGRVKRTYEINEMDEFDRDKGVAMIVMLSGIRELSTKRGDMMAVITVEDRYGSMEAVLFPRTWEGYKHFLREHENSVVLLKGKFDMRNDRRQVIVDSVTEEFEVFGREAAPNGTPNPYATPPTPHPDEIMESPVSHFDWGDDDEPDDDTPPPEPQNGYTSRPVPVASPSNGVTATPAVEHVVNPSGINWEQELSNVPHLDESRRVQNVSRWIYVYFQPHEEDADEVNRRRLRRIHNQLMQYSGSDRFTIIVERAENPVKMEFPHHRTEICDDLLRELTEIVGEGNIRIFDKS